MSDVEKTARTISVQHVTIASSDPFAEVRRRLEETVPQLDRTIVDALGRGDEQKVQAYDDAGPKLSIFLNRDHGALLQIAGHARNAIQYEIGNPLTASKMTRHQLAAGLYAPLRVLLYEDDAGRGVFDYDLPSSFFGQFGDERVAAVGRDLDAELEAALCEAAGMRKDETEAGA